MPPNKNDIHGKKRKRTEKEEDPASVFSSKLHHGLKEAKKAAKKAKTFETQKLVKKLKAARSKEQGTSQEVSDLEAQLEAIKHIEHDRVAATALRSKLRKEHKLWQDPSLQAAITSELGDNTLAPTTPGTPAAKVQSRLLSEKHLASELVTIVDSLKSALGLAPKLAAGRDEERDEEFSDETAPPKKISKKSKASSIKKGDDDSSDARDLEEKETASLGPGSVQEDKDQFEDDDNDSTPEDDDGWESGTVDGGDISFENKEVAPDSDEGSSDESGTEDSEDEDSQRSLPALRKAGGVLKAESTFLPSLSTVFIQGSSDSEWSDSEARIADGAKKKNRRGQRARRAIWEKKYGRNANHVKKQHEHEPAGKRPGKPSTHTGGTWPQKAPPYRKNDRSDTTMKGSNQRVTGDKNTGSAPRTEVKPRPEREERPLHPSWEAKKKLKEKQNASIIPPQGKKITF